MTLIVVLSSAISPWASISILRLRSPFATAFVTSAIDCRATKSGSEEICEIFIERREEAAKMVNIVSNVKVSMKGKVPAMTERGKIHPP